MECDRFKIFKFRETPGTSRDRTIEIDGFVPRAHMALARPVLRSFDLRADRHRLPPSKEWARPTQPYAE
jgi:hypothetical protein